jgi:hypothetical protein
MCVVSPNVPTTLCTDLSFKKILTFEMISLKHNFPRQVTTQVLHVLNFFTAEKRAFGFTVLSSMRKM